MSYKGRELTAGNYLKLDDIQSQFNSSTKTFSLTSGGNLFYPGSAFSIQVVLGGVIQETESAYTINQNQITFASAPGSGDDFFCIALGVSLGIGVPGEGTVTGTKLSKPFSYDDGLLVLDSTNNRIGVNSTTPTAALDIVGNAKVSGIVSATAFFGSGISTFQGGAVVGSATTFTEKLVVQGNARVTGILTVGTASVTIDGNNTAIKVGSATTIHSTGFAIGSSFLHSTGLSLANINAAGNVEITGTLNTNTFTATGQSIINRVAISTVGVNTTLETGRTYVYFVGVTSLTLPPSPVVGDTLKIINRSGITTALILRNGSNIMGVSDDLEFDEPDGSFTFTFTNSSEGWTLG
jgi:hypothetical protein